MKRHQPTRREALIGPAALSTLLLGADASAATGASDSSRPDMTFDARRAPDAQKVLAVLNYTAAAQIAALSRPLGFPRGDVITEATASWVSAAFYVGAARLARVSDEAGIRRFLTAVAEHYNYAFRGANGPNLVNADNLAIGDLYEECYALRRQAGMLMPLRQRADYMLPHLALEPAPPRLVWWWCDAFFMAPPVLARLSVLTGDPRYLEAMHVQWQRAHERLWDGAEKMYCRDERFVTRRSASGAKIFWSRAQGWSLAGLARVLESVPGDFHGRQFYVETFQQLAARIVTLQQADGLWRASLLDTHAFTEPENSGSAFFVYALAWGINHGLLSRSRYQPHVLRGWAALARWVQPNGLLGSVQRTGDQPVPTRPEDTGQYGTGAFLLAGLEMMRLSTAATNLPLAEPAPDTNDAQFFAPAAAAAQSPQTDAERAEAERRRAEVAAVRALAYDPDTRR